MDKHICDLAHEAGAMKARLETLLEAGKEVLSHVGTGGIQDETPDAGAALAFLRRAVDRAALPIESPEVKP